MWYHSGHCYGVKNNEKKVSDGNHDHHVDSFVLRPIFFAPQNSQGKGVSNNCHDWNRVDVYVTTDISSFS